MDVRFTLLFVKARRVGARNEWTEDERGVDNTKVRRVGAKGNGPRTEEKG